MALIPRKLVALICLLLAGYLSLSPAGAFEWSGYSRNAASEVVADASAYNALTIATCNGSSTIPTSCTVNLVTNKATTEQTFRLTEDTDPNSKVSTYSIGGGSSVASGAASTPSTVAVGSSATLTLNLVACGTLTGCPNVGADTFTTTWTVEGEKPNILNSIQTKVTITISYP